MGVGPDAPDIRGIDEMGAVGALDRQPRRGAARRGWPNPPSGAVITRCPAAAVEANAGAKASAAIVSVSAKDRPVWSGVSRPARRRGSGTSDSRKPAAITKQNSATTSDRTCCDAASPPP